MQEEREISLVGAMYTMAKRWKVMLLVAVLVFAAGYGFFLFKDRKAATAEPVSVAQASTPAESVKPDEAKKLKDNAEKYKKYLENSEFMKVDTSALHNRIIYYVIDWKETGLSGDDYENRSATLYGLLEANFPSEEFRKAISAIDSTYEEKSLDELIVISRSGNTVAFSIAYSDDSYVKDLEMAIDTELRSKNEKYSSLVGAYDLVLAQEVDRAVDGTDFKNKQNAKKTNLTNLEKELSELEKKAPANNASTTAGARGLFIGFKNILVCILAGIFCGLAVGFVMAVFGKRFESATDVSDLTGQDVVCAFKKEPESGLDRMYYKKNDRYRNPERYLSILDKNMEDAGIKKLHLYNCSGSDLKAVSDRICGVVKSLEVADVSDGDRERFYLNIPENEAVLILVKGGNTTKSDFIEIMEHLKAVSVKCAGVVFAV
ncbi:MAG: hypothetical protein J5537_04760 [Lachnospiraceae bacterium]|nr:hypothetical protein [Lachnospiraceae bacterium]